MKVYQLYPVLGLATLAWLVWAQPVPPPPAPTTYTYFTPNRVEEDFVATADNQSFQTTAPGVGSYVEVFRNGLLQRKGVDYTTVSAGGAQKVTFIVGSLGPVPGIGDYVTLFYYR